MPSAHAGRRRTGPALPAAPCLPVFHSCKALRHHGARSSRRRYVSGLAHRRATATPT